MLCRPHQAASGPVSSRQRLERRASIEEAAANAAAAAAAAVLLLLRALRQSALCTVHRCNDCEIAYVHPARRLRRRHHHTVITDFVVIVVVVVAILDSVIAVCVQSSNCYSVY